MKLYAILTVVLFTLFCISASCSGTYTQENKKESVTIKHKRIFAKGDLSIEKVTIEGHEYLLFYGRLATSPSVVHNENCPCKLKKEESYE